MNRTPLLDRLAARRSAAQPLDQVGPKAPAADAAPPSREPFAPPEWIVRQREGRLSNEHYAR